MDRTNSKSDTGLTRRDSRPVLYELVDKDGKVRSWKFSSAVRAAEYAHHLWPDQEQDEDRTGKGWDVQTVEQSRR